MTHEAALHKLSDTDLAEVGAANVWAGTEGLELLGALNAKAGTVGLGLNAVWRVLAGVTEGEAYAVAKELADRPPPEPEPEP